MYNLEKKQKAIMREIHNRVEQVMSDKNINKAILANRTGIKSNTIRGYINSGNNFTLNSLISIATALDVSIAYLVGEIETEKPNEEEYMLKYFKKLLNNK